eukprot:9194349-Heterocapsa_arctica.AAC.1
MATALAASKTTQKLKMGDLVHKVSKRTPAKIGITVLTNLSKYYVQFLESGDHYLVNELVDFHSAVVNPRELI